MTNRKNSSGVVEDIWINTQVDPDDIEPDGPDIPSNRDEIEEANVSLNPYAAVMDRG